MITVHCFRYRRFRDKIIPKELLRDDLEQLENTLLQEAVLITDEEFIAMDNAAMSDTAGIRWEQDPALEPCQIQNGMEQPPVLLDVMVTNMEGEELTMAQKLKALASTVSKEDVPKHDVTGLHIRREEYPSDMYSENDDIMYLGFPDLFLLGKGLKSKGPLSHRVVNHLMDQYCLRFAKSVQWIFTVFNQNLRATSAREVSVRATTSPEAFARFKEIVNDPTFLKLCRIAEKNPEGPEAARLMKDVASFLKFTGSEVSTNHCSKFGTCEAAKCF